MPARRLVPFFAPIQLLSILATVFAVAVTDGSTVWLSLVFALGFVHYLLGLYYSRRQIGQVLTQGHSMVPLLLVLASGAALYINDVPLLLYFAVHHAFNEVYVRGAVHAEYEGASRRLAAGVVFHFVAFALLVLAQFLPSGWLMVLLAATGAAFAVYIYELARIRDALGNGRFVDLCAFELVVLALIPVAFVYRFEFEQVVLYHFVFWTVYPLSRMLQQGATGAGVRYLGLTAATLGVFLFLSPIGPQAYNASVSLYYEQFILWSYVHITLSFALSRAHPQWITSWFTPRPPAVQSAVAR